MTWTKTAIAGCTFTNPDGSSRQGALAAAAVDDSVELVAEPDNDYDPHAVKVMHITYGQLGYLPKDLAHKLHAAAHHFPREGKITKLLGGTEDKPERLAIIGFVTSL